MADSPYTSFSGIMLQVVAHVLLLLLLLLYHDDLLLLLLLLLFEEHLHVLVVPHLHLLLSLFPGLVRASVGPEIIRTLKA